MEFRLALLVLLLASHARADEAPATVDLDLERFEGTWYELARFDSFFRRGCTGNTATYTRKSDTELTVHNRCFQDRLDGPEKTASGRLWRPDPAQRGKLKLQVVWPFVSDFWVLELGKDHEYAVVGNPKKTTLTILSRTPRLDEARFEAIVARLKARGYAVDSLHRTLQPAAAP